MPVPVNDPVRGELEKIYGPCPFDDGSQPFSPSNDDMNPRLAQAVDILGRVNGKTYPDNTPEFLRRSAVASDKAVRNISIFKDHTLEYPTLCLSVFVQPDPAVHDDEARFAKMFARAGCKRAASVLEADLVVFGGGSDVDPILYGEKPHNMTYPSPERDTTDMDLYLLCIEQGIPMMGICRGAQFLHVMNGGKLFQDVDGHYGDHPMWDISRKKHIEKVSSVHHQMVRENIKGGMEIIATSARSNERCLNNNEKHIGTHADIEAFFYRETCCIGVQGHPEYENYNYFTCWSLELVSELVFNNPDLVWLDKVLRMKPDILAMRSTANLPKMEVQVPAGKKEK